MRFDGLAVLVLQEVRERALERTWGSAGEGRGMAAGLDAVAARLLDLPATAPLRAAAVGLDLLLSSAQLWQETAASHVRMDAALAPLSSLATRWRGAELAGWRATLERVEADVAAGATFFF